MSEYIITSMKCIEKVVHGAGKDAKQNDSYFSSKSLSIKSEEVLGFM